MVYPRDATVDLFTLHFPHPVCWGSMNHNFVTQEFMGCNALLWLHCWFDKWRCLTFLWHTPLLRAPEVFWREKQTLKATGQWMGQQSGRKPGHFIWMAFFFHWQLTNYSYLYSCLLYGETIPIISCQFSYLGWKTLLDNVHGFPASTRGGFL